MIPVQNLYYLLAFSWRQFPLAERIPVGHIDHESLPDLFAQLLTVGIRREFQRGLDRDFVAVTEATARLRGRVAFGPTVRGMHLERGRAVCTFDELTPDILPNQILRSTIASLLRAPRLNEDLRTALREVYRQLAGVTVVRLSAKHFTQVRLHANNARYRFLLNCCAFVYLHRIGDPDAGERPRAQLRDLLRDEKTMARLFEDFVREFYRHHFPALSISSRKLSWGAKPLLGAEPHRYRLPIMKTDVTVRDPTRSRTLVIETKYYANSLASGQRGSPSFRSKHLYQLLAYLRATARTQSAGERIEGLLLYAAADDVHFDQRYEIEGFEIRLKTLDLGTPWQALEAGMKALLDISQQDLTLAARSS